MYKHLTPEDYTVSSIVRFGSHKDYIQEKILIDSFVIKGNMKMAAGLRKYIKKHLAELKSLPQIRLIDIGPAIGAITTLFALQELNRFNLMDKTRVYLVDVSQKVIDETREGNFLFPELFIDPSLKKAMLKKLKSAKGYTTSVETLPFKDNYFDIALAGFLFNNLHNKSKKTAAEQIQRIVKKGGFIGIAEEWFENYKKEYALKHAYDKIPLSYESIISPDKLLKYFDSIRITERSHKTIAAKENYYYFCCEK